jgi:signal peptidase I
MTNPRLPDFQIIAFLLSLETPTPMNTALPPPLPTRVSAKTFTDRFVIIVVVVVAIPVALCFSGLVVLRLTGMIRPFRVPTGGMSPAIRPGDQILMEALTYRWSKPHRGDVVVFRTDKISSIPGPTIYLQRLAGVPGDRLSIRYASLYVNEGRVSMHTKAGEIVYVNAPPGRYLDTNYDVVIVPSDRYFLLGDNSPNSYDSRYWGFLPASSVIGRAAVCYWPPGRIGVIH